MKFESTLDFGDRVIIDGDESMVAKVIAFKYMWAGLPLVELAYFHNGDQKSTFVEEPRLTKLA